MIAGREGRRIPGESRILEGHHTQDCRRILGREVVAEGCRRADCHHKGGQGLLEEELGT